MSSQLHVVNFGSANGGLSTVGYRPYNPNGTTAGARITSGVNEIGTSTGIYAANIGTIKDVIILWDTGTASPRYTAEEYRIQLDSIEEETDDIRKIWNSMRNQGEALGKIIEGLRGVKRLKDKDYTKDLEKILVLAEAVNKKDYPKLKDIKDALKIDIAPPIVNIPEVKIPDYSEHLKSMNSLLIKLSVEVNKIPKQYKDYTVELSGLANNLGAVLTRLNEKTQAIIDNLSPTAKSSEIKTMLDGLLHELGKMQDKVSTATEKLDKVDSNVTNTLKPAKLLQDIYAILEHSKDLKNLSDEYKRKEESLRLAGLL